MADSERLIEAMAGFVPEQGISFGARGGAATPVSRTTPLPAEVLPSPATSTPLAGTSASGGAIGPFAAQLGRPVWLTLAGSWSGAVTLLRSVDGGVTRLPLTYADGTPKPAFTRALNAAVTEPTVAGVTYWLDFARTAGSLDYRMEQ